MVSVRVERKGNAAARLNRIRSALVGPDRVKVGFPSGSAGNILDRAFWNEFGTVKMPERPFIRNAFNQNRAAYRAMMIRAAQQIMMGAMTKTIVLSQLGLKAAGDIQRSMPGTPPPNAPSTVRMKGSSTTLVDTGQMRQSVTWKLDD